jgi:hypothetical protein
MVAPTSGSNTFAASAPGVRSLSILMYICPHFYSFQFIQQVVRLIGIGAATSTLDAAPTSSVIGSTIAVASSSVIAASPSASDTRTVATISTAIGITSIIVMTTASPATSPSTTSGAASTTIHSIIGGVIGVLVLISLLLALFFFNRRRNNRRTQALSKMPVVTLPSPDIAIPFTTPSSKPTSTFLPQNHSSNGQSLFSSKFIQRDQPSDPASTSSSSGGIPLTPLRPRFKFSSPESIPSSSSLLTLTGSQTNLNGTSTTQVRVTQTATEPSRQRLPSARGANNARVLRHEDSGVRIPPAEDDFIELPPFYTPE